MDPACAREPARIIEARIGSFMPQTISEKKIPGAPDREQPLGVVQTVFFIRASMKLCALFRSHRFSQTVAGAPSSTGFLDQDFTGLQFLDVAKSRVRRALGELRILG